MAGYLQDLVTTAEKYPTRNAVVDHDGKRSTTYPELLDRAYRINAYLRKKGIGREQIVGIYYKKGMEYIATRIGVMMAGAAWVGLEDIMGKERIDFVIRDAGCVMVFDMEKWEEAMALPPCDEFADPDPHDLAFLVYTSGSTGTPKGAANEYGVYEYLRVSSFGFMGEYAYPNGRDEESQIVKIGVVFPETFLGGVIVTIGIIDLQGEIHEISPELTRDPKGLIKYFIDYKIDVSFMTASFLKVMNNISDLPLRAYYTGGELVSDIYSDRFNIHNIYGSAEFGYAVCLFKLDKAYDNTPVGYPTGDTTIKLLDEKGQESDEGILCVKLPYFRGYLNLDKMNEESFIYIDGERYFRTSDIAKKNENGCYTIIGRIDDMIKISGNRVDPAEIVSAMKRAFALKQCVIKVFDKNNGKIVAAYYTEDTVPQASEASRILGEYLPYYMIPSYFIRLDRIPLNANGKVDKQALVLPDAIGQEVDATSENELQERLSMFFEHVLNPGHKISIDDDFFRLGGDSLDAIKIIAESGIDGLSIPMIYEGRTIREITRLLEIRRQKSAKEVPLQGPLNGNQLFYAVKNEKAPDSTLLNLPARLNVRSEIDLNKLSEAVRKVFKAHRVVYTVIYKDEDGQYVQCYKPELDRDIPVEMVSDTELEEIVDNFVVPLTLDGTPLCRCRILCGETKKALLIDIGHIICDGTSLNLMINEFCRAYEGEPIPRDYYYELLSEAHDKAHKDLRERDLEYNRRRYDKDGYVSLPKADHPMSAMTDGEVYVDFPFSRKDVLELSHRYGLGQNGFYLAAAALALSVYNDAADILCEWNWDGRSDARVMKTVGMFNQDMPMSFHFEKEADISKLLSEVREQLLANYIYGNADYWSEQLSSYQGNDIMCVIYQGDIYESHSNELMESMEEIPNETDASENSLDVEILDGKEKYGVLLNFNASMYEEESMQRFAGLLCEMGEKIISTVLK